MSEMAAAPAPAAAAAAGATQGATPGVPGQSATAAAKQTATPSQNGGKPAGEAQYYEVKINGRPQNLTIDQLKSMAMMGGAATEKFQQASEKERKYQSWKDTASKDFIQALQDPELGLTREQIKSRFEDWYKENFIDPETLTKEEREARDWKKKAETLEAREKERQEKDQSAEREKMLHIARQELQQEIIETLEKSGLPITRFTASRIAFWKSVNEKNKYNAPSEVIIQQVKDEGQGILKAYVSESSPQQLVEFLGDEAVKKVRAYDIERLKAQRQTKQNSVPEPTSTGRRPSGGKSMRDVDRYFNDLRRSK